MKLDHYDSVYFLGIGGIGMSALARWFKSGGLKVAGYDKTPTPLTHELMEEGIEIQFEDRIECIPGYITPEKTLVVLTPAIPKDHLGWNYLKNGGFTILKRSEVLGRLTKNYKTIAVAGTHGKTTTSSLVAHLLKASQKNMVAFLGGITTNYESNLVQEGIVTDSTLVVAEADEFDRSFLRLFPSMAIVTSADADHLDIYGDHASMLQSYKDFIHQIERGGLLVVHESVAHLATGLEGVEVVTYGKDSGMYHAENIRTQGGFFRFDLTGPDFSVKDIELGVPGFHNMENAIAAGLIAGRCGVNEAGIRSGLLSFKGVKRRFEFVLRTPSMVFIDDYAHHPAEIAAFLGSLRAMYPGKKLSVVFQPHLYTRTRDFADEFATSLSIADTVFMMDIYPARELPIEGVTSDIIFNSITASEKIRCSKKDLLQKIAAHHTDVLATVGAGDIDTFVKPIKELLSA
ncbi:MAG: UDP-N-acetylmuramate--L-alanine ligase [Bacteroidetes bacterium]|nr:UDP-N-acetylmuramate--L-alanine ligase [Bacteroidota bacterium]